MQFCTKLILSNILSDKYKKYREIDDGTRRGEIQVVPKLLGRQSSAFACPSESAFPAGSHDQYSYFNPSTV